MFAQILKRMWAADLARGPDIEPRVDEWMGCCGAGGWLSVSGCLVLAGINRRGRLPSNTPPPPPLSPITPNLHQHPYHTQCQLILLYLSL